MRWPSHRGVTSFASSFLYDTHRFPCAALEVEDYNVTTEFNCRDGKRLPFYDKKVFKEGIQKTHRATIYRISSLSWVDHRCKICIMNAFSNRRRARPEGL